MNNDIIGLDSFKGTPIEKAVKEQEFQPYDQEKFDEYMDDWKAGKYKKDGKKISQEEAIQNAFKIAQK